LNESKKRQSAGFTLIELIVVIVLIGILSLAMVQVPDPGQLEVREARRELAIQISGGILEQINSRYGAGQARGRLPGPGLWTFENGALVVSPARDRHPFQWIINEGNIHYALRIADADEEGGVVRKVFLELYDTDRSEKSFALLSLILGNAEVPK
jgi:prepilin-type N-terminal cleavage/methylation domain-containing protein